MSFYIICCVMSMLPNHIDANSVHLRRLYFLRIIFIVTQLLALLIAQYVVHIQLNVYAILVVVSVQVLFNIQVWRRLSRLNPVSNNEIFRNLLVDIAALTVILYYAGGATNPFITLFIFPIIISVTVLPARFAWLLAAITIASYSFLMRFYVPMEMGHMAMGHGQMMDKEFNLHIVGMWLAFALSAGLIAHFVFKMGSTIRFQEEQLIKAREKALIDRQIIELGTLAASTAHELGTPLGTMNLLTTELKKELSNASTQVRGDLDLLKQQIDRCKDALANLSASAGSINISGGTLSTVADYLSKVLESWQEVRPDIKIKTLWQETDLKTCILDDRTLTQAIMNILDNAADVSPLDVEWEAMWDTQQLVMEVRDRGAGLSEDLKQKLGKQPIGQHEHGMGLGLFLSHAIVERFGGSVNLFNREGGGITTQIVVPLVNDIGKSKSI